MPILLFRAHYAPFSYNEIMSLKDAKKAFFTAKHDLEQLEGELPNFERLLTDNQEEERKLRQAKAPLADLAAAKGRMNVARELLEQHKSDIGTARAEVSSLTVQIDRAEKQAHLDELNAEQAELASAWEAKALEAGRTIAQALDDLYALEQEVCLTARAVNQAVQALGQEADWTAPNFSLTPLLLSEVPQGRHLGSGTIAFQPNRAYEVTLSPRLPLGAWRA
jgi:chromosome segregation ATPase